MTLDFTELNCLKQAVLSGETILKINSHIKYEDLKIFNSLSDEQKSKLIWLDLSRSDISNSELPDFSKCVSLERLNLSYNNISDMKKIKGLNKLKNLTFLNLDYNFKIKRIENIDGLIN